MIPSTSKVLTELKRLKLSTQLAAMLCTFFYACDSFATEAEICSQPFSYFVNDSGSKLEDPSRLPTEAESVLIKNAEIELFEIEGRSTGDTPIVDADNDGKEDLFAWATQGSGRFVSAEVYEVPTPPGNAKLVKKASIDLGVLQDPRFIRFKGVNYIVSTDTGDKDGIRIGQLEKIQNGQYQMRTRCIMQTSIRTETKCRHPACKALAELIENKDKNGPFVNVEWPHKYFPPAGLEVFFSERWSYGDFDNTNNPTSIWRIGRSDYVYQNVYWTLLGQGAQLPEVNPELRPIPGESSDRCVLPGRQHDRLRRTLTQQSETLSNQGLISPPGWGEFFLFNANGKRTYWAWDLEEQPYGDEIHIVYTNAKKSDYIGMIKTKRTLMLTPCVAECVTPLQQ